MSVGSEDSLGDIPLPYDISTAVSRALRINSTANGTTQDNCTANVCPLNCLTTFEKMNNDLNIPRQGSLQACYQPETLDQRYIYSTHIPSHQQDYSTVPTYPQEIQYQMEVEAWSECTAATICSSSEDLLNSEINTDQLDQFCKYIDCSEDEEYHTGSPIRPPPPAYPYQRHYTIAEDYVSPALHRVSEPPRKKNHSLNSMSYFNEDSGFSPVKHTSAISCYPSHPQPLSSDTPWRVKLGNVHLWRQFDQIGTEMVITKGGRRMFPSLVVNISGLNPSGIYSLKLEIVPADNKRYKFLQTEWVPVGKADKKNVYREYVHPDSPSSGSYWMEKEVNFKLVKLTNNKNTKFDDQMILNSMQKYQPCLKITCENSGMTECFSFPETKFIAVTAYQNSSITQLKINNNPYARAFREDGSTEIPKSDKTVTYKLRERSSSPIYSKRRTRSRSPQSPASPSPEHQPPRSSYPTTVKCTSAVSVESGFESGDCSEQAHCHQPDTLSSHDLLIFQDSRIISHPNPYSSNSLSYWADDNSLWNPNLITPDPLMDSTGSFSEPYLQQSSRMSLYENISPVKGLCPVDSAHSMLNDTIQVDVETVDDDVFF